MVAKRPQHQDFPMTTPREVSSFIDDLKGLLLAVLLIGFLDAFGGGNQLLSEQSLDKPSDKLPLGHPDSADHFQYQMQSLERPKDRRPQRR